MQWVLNSVRTKVRYRRITKHITACLSVYCVWTNMYHTDTHVHATAKAVPRKKPAAKEEDDDLRELAAWASWTHLTLGQGERRFSFTMCYQALIAMISVTVLLLYTNLWDIHVYLFTFSKTGLLVSYICKVHNRLSNASCSRASVD